VFQPCTRQKYVVPWLSTWLCPIVQDDPPVWLFVVVVQLITQPGQVVVFGSVGNVPLFVATVSQYRFAPVTLDQVKLGVVDTPVAPFDGVDRVGAGNNDVAVVKLPIVA